MTDNVIIFNRNSTKIGSQYAFFFQCTGSQVEYSIELLFGSDSCDCCRDFSTLKYLYLPCLAGQ